MPDFTAGFAAAPTEPPAPSSNLPLAIIGGALAAIVGAVVWAAITIITNFEVGYVAVGLAFLVGLAVRNLGRGDSQVYGVVGAICSLAGIALGKIFTLIWFVADKNSVSVFAAISHIDWGKAIQVIGENLGPIDFVFGFFAIVLGFKYSMRKE